MATKSRPEEKPSLHVCGPNDSDTPMWSTMEKKISFAELTVLLKQGYEETVIMKKAPDSKIQSMDAR